MKISFLVQTMDMSESKVSTVSGKSFESCLKQVRTRFPKGKFVIMSYRDLETDKVYKWNEEEEKGEICK